MNSGLLTRNFTIVRSAFKINVHVQGWQKTPATEDIAGYDLPVKRENVGGGMVLLPPECRLLKIFLTTLHVYCLMCLNCLKKPF